MDQNQQEPLDQQEVEALLKEERAEIKLSNCQIKNLTVARKIARAINILEENTGIRETILTLENVFICPWIDLDKLNQTQMECCVRDILKGIRDREEDEKE